MNTTMNIESTAPCPRIRLRACVLLLAGVLLFSASATAQPQINFKRIVNNWPWIELYFTAQCGGMPLYVTDKKNIAVYENGVEVRDFELLPVDTIHRCPMSVELVLDASGSMIGDGNAGAKVAADSFIDLMDGIIDEAAILWFNSLVVVEQGMTPNLGMLRNAVSALPARDSSAVWDACYSGLEHLIANGVNPCRAVVVMTDGDDNASTHTPSQVIWLANRNRIRVFTIGLGSVIHSDTLRMISDLTGGRYYERPNAAQVLAIYQEITTVLITGDDETIISYITACMDGNQRKVDLSLVNICNGQDTKTKTYKAPKDTSTFQPLRFGIAKREALANADVTVPLELRESLSNEMLNTAMFAIQFDTSLLSFKAITIPPGSALEGVPISVNENGDTIIIRTLDKKPVDGPAASATLFERSFTSARSGRKGSV